MDRRRDVRISPVPRPKRVHRDLAGINKGSFWAAKGSAIAQAKADIQKEATEGGASMTAGMQKQAILARAHMLAEAMLKAVASGGFTAAFSSAGARLDDTVPVQD